MTVLLDIVFSIGGFSLTSSNASPHCVPPATSSSPDWRPLVSGERLLSARVPGPQAATQRPQCTSTWLSLCVSFQALTELPKCGDARLLPSLGCRWPWFLRVSLPLPLPSPPLRCQRAWGRHMRLRDSGSESSTFIPLSALRLGNFMGSKFKFTDCFFPLL